MLSKTCLDFPLAVYFPENLEQIPTCIAFGEKKTKSYVCFFFLS